MKKQTLAVLDSGIGGLEILEKILNLDKSNSLDLIYFSDSEWFPYGQKNKKQILDRVLLITDYLVNYYAIFGLFIACNTATTLTINSIKRKYQKLLVMGVEPKLEYMTKNTITKRASIIGTYNTLTSKNILKLKQKCLDEKVVVYTQACDGLAYVIENYFCNNKSKRDRKDVTELCSKYLNDLGISKNQANRRGIDLLVLGCTHYALIIQEIKFLIREGISVLNPGHQLASDFLKKMSSSSIYKGNAKTKKLRFISTSRIDKILFASSEILNKNKISRRSIFFKEYSITNNRL